MDTDVLTSPAFLMYSGIGLFAVSVIIIGLKLMNSSEVMPFYVKILAIIITPLIAYLFALRDQ